MNKILAIIIFIFSIAVFVNGHGLGQSLEKQVNGLIMDIGYDAIDSIYAEDTIHFDFNLWKDGKTEIVDFSHVWVRIAPGSGEGIVFTGFLHRPEFVLTGMSYTFQKPGEYELTVRFLDKDDNILAEESFPLTVEKSGSGLPMNIIIGLGIGIVVGAGVTFFLVNKRNSA